MKLLKNIIGVAFSNITNFGISFIIGFILPAILSVTDYGYYREYSLYLSFAYLFNLGYNDGIYIKYGGHSINTLNKKTVKDEHSFVMVFQLVILGLMLIFGVLRKDTVLLLFSLATFFVTMNTYHQNFLQAIGDFNTYSKGNILKSIFYVVILLFATLVFKSDNYIIYVILNIISLAFILIYYEFKNYRTFGYNNNINFNNKIDIFKIGIFILIANMSLTFVGNVGNWIVNFGFSIEEFAQYSFQNSVLNVILLIVNAVGLVFYNVISKDNRPSILKVIKELSLLLGVYSGITFFIFSFIIERFLPNYIASIPMLSMTFISIPYIMISKILIANIYKTSRSEKKYFKDTIIFALSSIIIVGLAFILTNSMIMIALATSLSYIAWYLYATKSEFPNLKGGKNEFLLLVSHIIIFYLSSNILNIGTGLLLYSFYLLLVLFLYKNRVQEIISTYFKS